MTGAVAASVVVTAPDNSQATQSAATLGPAGPSAGTTAVFPPPLVVPLDPPKSAAQAGAGGATLLPASALPAGLTTSAGAIPHRVLVAYVAAARDANRQWPGCNLPWYLLAGIGYIESDHGRGGGSDRRGWTGLADPPIYGPMLDGRDGVTWPDTDNGSLDGSRLWDRAVGPMQFMPTTWAMWGADGNHDRHADPQQIDDATLAAADYLCAAGGELTSSAGRIRAVYSYNHSVDYVRAVLTVAAQYAGLAPAILGTDLLPASPSPTTSPATSPTVWPSPARTHASAAAVTSPPTSSPTSAPEAAATESPTQPEQTMTASATPTGDAPTP